MLKVDFHGAQNTYTVTDVGNLNLTCREFELDLGWGLVGEAADPKSRQKAGFYSDLGLAESDVKSPES